MRRGVKVIALPLSLTVMAIALIAVSLASTQSDLKYTIDGNLSDWGVDLTGDWSLNETWVPNKGIEFVVEDNNDPHHKIYAVGVHIKGVGSSYEYYYEPKVCCSPGEYKVEPIGGEPYDVEAKYLDEDENYIYVAIVTSMNPNGSGNLEPIDFAMNLDGNDSTGEYGYEYGVKLHTSDGIPQWDIYYLPDWAEPQYCPMNRPGKMVGALPGGGKTGTAIGAYVQCTSCNLGKSCRGTRYSFVDPNSTGCDHGVPNYVVEMAIPKSAVNMTGKNLTKPPFPKALWTCDTCGNDKIENSIPEFLTVVIPAAALICFVFFIHRRRWGGGK